MALAALALHLRPKGGCGLRGAGPPCHLVEDSVGWAMKGSCTRASVYHGEFLRAPVRRPSVGIQNAPLPSARRRRADLGRNRFSESSATLNQLGGNLFQSFFGERIMSLEATALYTRSQRSQASVDCSKHLPTRLGDLHSKAQGS